MHDAPKPESFEKHLCFGCGFIVGAFVAYFALATHLTESPGTFAASVSILANLFGVLAMYCGARFWSDRSN
jgi:hypothetical protein